jgi:Domain of unknown function (DUF4282)
MNSTITCEACGEVGDAKHRFCASCGARRPEAAAPEPVPPAPVAPEPPAYVAPEPRPHVAPPHVAPPPVAPPPVAPPPVAPPPVAPPPVAPPPVAPPPVNLAAFDAKGFLRSLYDFKFTSLIATKVIRFVYALLVIVYSIFAALTLIACLASKNGALIFFGFIILPLLYLLYLIMIRILMEMVVVFFKMGEDVRAIRYGSAGTTPPPAG